MTFPSKKEFEPEVIRKKLFLLKREHMLEINLHILSSKMWKRKHIYRNMMRNFIKMRPPVVLKKLNIVKIPLLPKTKNIVKIPLLPKTMK